MHRIILYSDSHGREPVTEYIEELEKQKTKDSRIRLTKIRAYIQALAINGLPLTVNLCKHIDGEIWELRPTKDRILFAGWVEGAFVLLHSFEKQTQKTPKQEIERAKREFEDFKERWKENE
ncbi:MAG: type II toxin-antitoxin system RelE/ParE family toxin [Clostridia bacterium]|nr:type II toxin-antitoxin system RelE/ParE family toxin [Clostridia bacterium]